MLRREPLDADVLVTRDGVFTPDVTERSPLLPVARNTDSVVEEVHTAPESVITESEDSEDEAERRPKKKVKTSKYGTLLHLLKANIGTGILAMPIAISNIGLLAGSVGIILLGFVCIYCMHILVSCSKTVASKMRKEERRRHLLNVGVGVGSSAEIDAIHALAPSDGLNNEEGFKRIRSLDYASTIEQVFRFGPKKFKKMARGMRYTVNILLVLTQFGFCCVYFLFVSQSLHKVFVNMNVLPSFAAFDLMLMELPFMIVLNFIPNLKNLTGISTTAVVLQSVGLVMMFGYFVSGEKSETVIPFLAPVNRWPLYFGTAMYAFEGIGVVLPLENDIKRKKDFRGWTGVLNVGMCIVVVFYITIGVCGYVKYGADVEPSITFNLPEGCSSELIRLMFAIAIFLSYPLQMYVPFSFMLPYLKGIFIRDSFSGWIRSIIECVIRAFFVILTFAIASAVPMLDLVISFVGSFASSGLALILPPIIQILTIWDADIRYKKWIIGFDIFICLFGFFGLIVGSGTAVWEIWKNFHTNSTNSSHSQILSYVRETAVQWSI